MAKRTKQDRDLESAMGGASDATSGGGAGRGIPDADTLMRLGHDIGTGDVEADKAKLFPELAAEKRKKATGKTGVSKAAKGKVTGRQAAGRTEGRMQGKKGNGNGSAKPQMRRGSSGSARQTGRGSTAKRGK